MITYYEYEIVYIIYTWQHMVEVSICDVFNVSIQ